MRKQAHWSCLGSPTKTLLALAAAAVSLHAAADNLPLSLTVSETLSRDSNLYRVAPGQYAVADTVSSTGLKMGLDKSYGRQRYLFTAGTALNRYFDSTKLNNTSYNINLGLQSEFADKGLLQLNGNASQNLARFDIANTNSITSAKNTQNTSQFNGQVSYGGYGSLNPYVSLNHFQQGFTYTSSSYQAMNQNTYGLGTYYNPVSQLSLGLGARLTKGDINYDIGGGNTLTDNVKRRDIDLTANWTATGLSTLYARISATHSQDDFIDPVGGGIQNATSKGLTGELKWAYKPQGRFDYSLDFSRDKGNVGRGYLSVYDYTDPITKTSGSFSQIQRNENNRLANNLYARVNYDLTYKIKLFSEFSYTKYHLYQNIDTIYSDPQFASTQTSLGSQSSHYTQFSIGGKYNYARWLDVYCEIRRIKRTQDAEYTPFNSTVTSCTGQFNINGMN